MSLVLVLSPGVQLVPRGPPLPRPLPGKRQRTFNVLLLPLLCKRISSLSVYSVRINLDSFFSNYPQTRPRTPWHVGPLKVGLLSVNTPQNPPDPQAYQTHRPTTRPRAHQFHGPTRPTGPPHKRAHPPGPTTPRPVVRNSEKM